MRISIIGGGIVGLTTALSLARVGFKPTVYEAVRNPSPLGYPTPRGNLLNSACSPSLKH